MAAAWHSSMATKNNEKKWQNHQQKIESGIMAI